MKLLANDPRVVDFYEAQQSKARNANGHFIGSTQNEAGLLYVIQGKAHYYLQVWLPRDLLEYANAAAGTSGERPVGIRVGGYATLEQAGDAILDIFSSPQSLANFINDSECDFAGVVKTPRVVTNDTLVKNAVELVSDKYGKNVFLDLAKKFGRETVLQARELLTVNEFELRFGL